MKYGDIVAKFVKSKDGEIVAVTLTVPLAPRGANVNDKGNDVRYTSGRWPLELPNGDKFMVSYWTPTSERRVRGGVKMG